MTKTIHKLLQIELIFLSFLQLLSGQQHEIRYQYMDVISYDFRITLNDSTDMIRGDAELNISINKESDTIAIDLANINSSGKGMIIQTIRNETGPVRFFHSGNKVLIPNAGIQAGSIQKFYISYQGIPADGLIISKNKYGDRTFFGDNWPDRAHQWLPCVDHPSDKATLEFTINAPAHYQVVANGKCTWESINNGILSSHWETSVPLPTKLMVIGVARFDIQNLASVSGVPVTSWVFPQNKDEGFSDYAVAVKPLLYFSRLIDPFPFTKLANVQSTTPYGGMENASCIFYSENSVPGMGRTERLMAHEIAHQWFGDAVTEKEWAHIWLSEGFATYLTGMYIEHTYGKGPFLRHLNAEKEEVFEYEKQKYSAVMDTTLSVSADLLNPNTYQKASWVLHMLRKELGDSLFISCLQTFYRSFKYKNATTDDFLHIVESVSSRDFNNFFNQWIYQSGHPVLDITWTHKDAFLILTIKQVQENIVYRFPLELKIINKNSVSNLISLDITDTQNRFSLNYSENPIEIIPDPGNWLLMESVVKEEKNE